MEQLHEDVLTEIRQMDRLIHTVDSLTVEQMQLQTLKLARRQLWLLAQLLQLLRQEPPDRP